MTLNGHFTVHQSTSRTISVVVFVAGFVFITQFVLFVHQVNPEHSHAMVPVFSADVLEDLFETTMQNNGRRCQPSDVCYFQSTQVSRSDVPDCTIVIQPDFPLSPLRCAAPAVTVNSNCSNVFTSPVIHSAGRLCSEVEMLTINAAHSRPTTTVCSEAQVGLCLASSQSPDVTLPSAVYDRIRNLFCMSDSEMNQNRLSDTLSNSTADTRQQNQSVDELPTEADEIIGTSAVSCNGGFSPLDSSYVDVGRMAYTQSDVNVVSAADVPVMTTCIENNTTRLRITNVRTLSNNMDMVTSPEITHSSQLPHQETYVKGRLSSRSKNASQGDQSPFRAKKLKSPTDNAICLDPSSGSNQKRSTCRKTESKCGALFKQTEKTKRACKKRKLYRHNMLVEDIAEEQAPHETGSACVSRYNIDVDADTNRKKGRETVVSGREISPAAAALPTSQAADCSETSTDQAVDYVNKAVASGQNSVEVTRVKFDATQPVLNSKTDLNTRHAVSLSQCPPAGLVHKLSLEQQIEVVQHDQAIVAETSRGTEVECEVAAVVSTSASVLRDALCTVNSHVASVSVPSPAVCLTSAEWPMSLSNACNRWVSADSSSDTVPSSSDTLLSSSDSVPDRSQRNTPETNEVPVCMLSVSNTRDPEADPILLPSGDNADVAQYSFHQSKSHKECSRQSHSSSENVKSVSLANTVDRPLRETETVKDRDVDRCLPNKRRNLSSKKKFDTQTSMVTRARTNMTDRDSNVVTLRRDINDDGETQSRENTSSASAARPCVPSRSADESNSPSLLCGQKQSGGSYCLPHITMSGCCLSALGTPFPPSHSCSKQRCHVAEESYGYHPSSTKADEIVTSAAGNRRQLMHSERRSSSESVADSELNTSNACRKEQSCRTLPTASGMSDVCTSSNAAIMSGTKQSLSVPSNGSSRLTLPTPKNSLPCYQQASSLPSAAAVSNSSVVSAASQVRPNYAAIQVFIFYSFALITLYASEASEQNIVFFLSGSFSSRGIKKAG